jgi:hypothetical protein
VSHRDKEHLLISIEVVSGHGQKIRIWNVSVEVWTQNWNLKLSKKKAYFLEDTA